MFLTYLFVVSQALQRFFASLVHSAKTSFDSLLDALLSSAKPSPQSGGLAKQALFSVAQCVAVLCLAAGDQKCASTVEMLKSILKDDSSSNSVRFHATILFYFIFFSFPKVSFILLLEYFFALSSHGTSYRSLIHFFENPNLFHSHVIFRILV